MYSLLWLHEVIYDKDKDQSQGPQKTEVNGVFRSEEVASICPVFSLAHSFNTVGTELLAPESYGLLANKRSPVDAGDCAQLSSPASSPSVEAIGRGDGAGVI